MATGGDDNCTPLLERGEFLAALDHAFEEASAGRGRLVLLGGEAGVGKTAVLHRFRAEHPRADVLWGACERLFTPRALGPFIDIAQAAGGDVERLMQRGAAPYEVVGAVRDMVDRRPVSVLVLEDVQWADEGTLDVVKLLARHVAELSALVIVSYRDDQVSPTDPLQVVIGELAGAPAIERLHLPPLSPSAVAALAEPEGIDPARLYQRTAGNPFFVTEVLAARDVEIPATVRDAVLARAAHLPSEARRVLEAAAVVPARIELWLLEAIAHDDLDHLGDCLSSGMLHSERPFIAFRHELARAAIEEAIAPHRRLTLHRRVLAALSAAAADPARLAHHAEAAGDAGAVLEYAPAAAERASALGAHHQAAEQYRRALRHADALPAERQADLYERLAYEQHLSFHDLRDALTAAEAALEIRRRLGQRVEEGAALAFVARVLWFVGRATDAEAVAREAVTVLQALPPGRELAVAYADLARLAGLAHQTDEAQGSALRAIELAEQVGATDVLSSALNTLGISQLRAGSEHGWSNLARSRELAEAAGSDDDTARALVNLAGMALELREYRRAAISIEEGMEYIRERELGRARAFLFATRARWHLDQGEWDAALDDAEQALRPDWSVPLMRVAALVIIGLVRARRGERAAEPPLEEALALAVPEELQQLAPVAAALAEAAWLRQEPERIGPATDAAFALARERGSAPFLAELAYWRFKAGLMDEIPDWTAEPHASLIRGDWGSAAAQWRELGCPYEAALALAESGEEEPTRIALSEFQRLGALPAAAAATRRLRDLGVRSIGHGPRRATRASPAQLTARQQEVLRLLGDQLTNAEIAARLYISPKTVDHHVTAILGKLGVHSRKDAAAEAVRLGLTET